MVHILIVEGDSGLNRFVCSYLDNSGFITKECLNARDACDEMYNTLCGLTVSDIMMPEVDGFEFTRTVRQVSKTVPILSMFAGDGLNSKQKGFQFGVGGYMAEPIEVEELLLRVRALLHRTSVEAERKITIGSLTLNVDAVIAVVSGTELPVTTRELNILHELLSYPNKTFPREQLVDKFWGLESDIGLRTVDVYITGIRKRFSACDDFSLKIVRGPGYKAVLQWKTSLPS